jgi:predicted ArsR family transcriptional regulator
MDRRAAPPPMDRRREVLRILRAAPEPLSINDIVSRLEVHPNTVRFHLQALVEQAQVERVEPDRRGPGRPPLLFRPVRGMDRTGPRRYRLLAELLATELATGPEPAARAVEAGRAWGRRQAAPRGRGDSVTRLVGLLDDVGFAPVPRREGDQAQIGLRHCPFLELAETGSRVVCLVHLGLMRGAMEAWRSPLTVDRLEPFVEPDLCLAHLAPAGAD